MKISIITVVYNNRSTIREAIESVLSQNLAQLEYLIIDGGSTDGTLDIIKSFSSPVMRVFSEPDGGIYDAMNKGIRNATGDIIGILNSDDLYYDSNVLQDVLTAFAGNPSVSLLYGDLVYVSRNNVDRIVRRWKSKAYYSSFFEDGNVPPHPTLFARSSVYQTAGLFRLQYKLAADYELMLRVMRKHSFKSLYLDRLMIKMRLGGATNKSLKNIFKGNVEILEAWRANGLRIPLKLVPFRIVKRLSQFM